jgi:hypothetical protein
MSLAVRIVLVPAAEAEFEQSRMWYENRRAGLGIEFAEEVDACLERIRRNPESYPRLKKDYRQAIVKRFPFAIYYEFSSSVVTVYSIFHCSQDPAKLDERLR